MTDIFLEIDDTNRLGYHDTICIRRDNIVSITPDRETGNANVLVLWGECTYHTSIPYDKFIKQFMVIKMNGEK